MFWFPSVIWDALWQRVTLGLARSAADPAAAPVQALKHEPYTLKCEHCVALTCVGSKVLVTRYHENLYEWTTEAQQQPMANGSHS